VGYQKSTNYEKGQNSKAGGDGFISTIKKNDNRGAYGAKKRKFRDL
jgi:hypothetical protein